MSRRRREVLLKLSNGLLLLLAICSPALLSGAPLQQKAPAGTATRAIQDLEESITTFRTGEKLSEPDRKYNRDLKKQIVHGTFDIRELARLAMGPHWEEQTKTEQDHLVDLMIGLIEERALLSKEHSAMKGNKGSKYRIAYKGERYLNKDKTRAYVKTVVQIPSEKLNITLSYKLKRAEQQWKIYDLIVDDASLVENYRYQFHSIITDHGYPDLVKRIEKKLHGIQEERKK